MTERERDAAFCPPGPSDFALLLMRSVSERGDTTRPAGLSLHVVFSWPGRQGRRGLMSLQKSILAKASGYNRRRRGTMSAPRGQV